MTIKMELVIKDRVGIVADISAIVAQYNMNIVSMEVEQREGNAHVFMETFKIGDPLDENQLCALLSSIPDLMTLKYIDILPQKERENRFKVVLDNISDGVISIDVKGCITTMNKVARQAANCMDLSVIGLNIREIDLPDYMVLECLEGKKFSHVKKNIISGNERYQYFATGQPIVDAEGHICGAVEIAKDMQEIKRLAQSISNPEAFSFSDIVGQHPAITSAIAFGQRIARSDAIISIRGASGTGKELFARAIHMASGRKGHFVPLNCAALPEQLLESELFGYVGGAFTGGRREGHPGLFEYAQQGTLFLDEIGEMPLTSQAKILRVIQDKRVRRIGGSKGIPVDTCIITATHRNLEQLVEHKLFRSDLYYRINVLPIHIPPLSQRTEDIPLLANHFLFQLSSKLNKPTKALSNQAMEKLCCHSWPGNVRELKNVIERAAILGTEKIIEASAILFSHELGRLGHASLVAQATDFNSAGSSLKTSVLKYERELINQVMQKCRSKREAARILGISHTALLNKLKRYHT
jgi:TyrR family helix-turn-helix protein